MNINALTFALILIEKGFKTFENETRNLLMSILFKNRAKRARTADHLNAMKPENFKFSINRYISNPVKHLQKIKA